MADTGIEQREALEGGAVYRRAEGVVRRTVAGETLLVPVRKGLADLQRLFALNDVGGLVWERLDGTTPLDAVLEAVLERFDVSADEARADLAAFVGQLSEAKLVERRP